MCPLSSLPQARGDGTHVSTPTVRFPQAFLALATAIADVKSCRSRTMHRLRSVGDIERLDGPCRQFPHCPRNSHKRSIRQPTRSDAFAAKEGRQDRTPLSRSLPWHQRLHNHRISGSIPSPPGAAHVRPARRPACPKCCTPTGGQPAGRCDIRLGRPRRPMPKSLGRCPSAPAMVQRSDI